MKALQIGITEVGGLSDFTQRAGAPGEARGRLGDVGQYRRVAWGGVWFLKVKGMIRRHLAVGCGVQGSFLVGGF